ncbi:MAG: [FeFe] hydrogenase H-cluster radical SAM maturase HydE, partial [Anaerotruncus massiliensis (ex Togo et al. 2019)]
LPATTSLGVIDGKEKNDVFSCGANVIMRKVTPDAYKQKYEIYPAALGHTDIKAERAELENMIRGLGKIPQ